MMVAKRLDQKRRHFKKYKRMKQKTDRTLKKANKQASFDVQETQAWLQENYENEVKKKSNFVFV